jgi:hypothetical protein
VPSKLRTRDRAPDGARAPLAWTAATPIPIPTLTRARTVPGGNYAMENILSCARAEEKLANQ